MEAEKIFRLGYKGDKNIMTPNIVGYFFSENKEFVFEIATGSGIGGGGLTGCSVVDKSGTRRSELNRVWHRMAIHEAKEYGYSLTDVEEDLEEDDD